MRGLALDKDYNAAEKEQVCNCIVNKYEELYPDGIKHKIGIDTLKIISKICSPR